LKGTINDLGTYKKKKKKTIRGLCGKINKFKKGYQPGT
jgi:hypothetical protein